jgi:hypothetical protein
MGLFSTLFGGKKQINGQSRQSEPEHAVIVTFDYGIEGLDQLHQLGDKLEQAITDGQVGEYDGHEIAMDYSDGTFYMYGPNAEELFKVVKPLLETTEFMKGAIAKLRFGEAGSGAKEIEVKIE